MKVKRHQSKTKTFLKRIWVFGAQMIPSILIRNQNVINLREDFCIVDGQANQGEDNMNYKTPP